MNSEMQPIDIAGSPELVRLAEEVRRSGVSRLLILGEEELAVLAPAPPSARNRRRVRPKSAEPDAILNIIGIGESTEPTDVARHEREYLAEAYEPRLR